MIDVNLLVYLVWLNFIFTAASDQLVLKAEFRSKLSVPPNNSRCLQNIQSLPHSELQTCYNMRTCMEFKKIKAPLPPKTKLKTVEYPYTLVPGCLCWVGEIMGMINSIQSLMTVLVIMTGGGLFSINAYISVVGGGSLLLISYS